MACVHFPFLSFFILFNVFILCDFYIGIKCDSPILSDSQFTFVKTSLQGEASDPDLEEAIDFSLDFEQVIFLLWCYIFVFAMFEFCFILVINIFFFFLFAFFLPFF